MQKCAADNAGDATAMQACGTKCATDATGGTGMGVDACVQKCAAENADDPKGQEACSTKCATEAGMQPPSGSPPSTTGALSPSIPPAPAGVAITLCSKT